MGQPIDALKQRRTADRVRSGINLKNATAFGLTILKPLVRAEELVEN
jgi:hypothetical protein